MDKFTELYEQLMGEASGIRLYGKDRSPAEKFKMGAAGKDIYKKSAGSTGGKLSGTGSGGGGANHSKLGGIYAPKKVAPQLTDAQAKAAWAKDRRNPEARERLEAQRKAQEAAASKAHYAKQQSQQAMYQQYLRDQGKL